MSAVRVHHIAEGPSDAPVLVLSNSLGGTLAMWDPQAAVLSEHFRLVRYDLRGHGGSPVPRGPYEIDDLGSDLVGLLQELGADRAHLCGTSIGGLVSMWVAAHAPERVDRLLLCCTSAWFGDPERWFARAATVREQGTGAVADAVVARWFTPGFALRHPDVVARMREMIVGTPAEGYASCCEVVGKADLRPSLAAIVAPTLVVAGAQDPAAPPEQAEQIAHGIAGARVALVPDAAHLANVERPDQVSGLILGHLLE